MLQVFRPIIVVDEDIIKIHHHKRIGERPQDIVHHSHEICWVIFQANGHDKPFKKTFFGLEGSLPYICLLYWDLVLVVLHINLTKVLGLLELVKEIFNSRNWVSVPDSDFI